MDLEEAKSAMTIHRLWEYYALPGQPKRSCKSPFREDRNPSFSVTEDGQRWKDFGTGEGGDAIDFISRCEGIENKDACLKIIELAGGKPGDNYGGKVRRQARPARSNEKPKEINPIAIQKLRLGTDQELQQVCDVRGFPPYALDGLRLLQERGLLRFYEKRGEVFWLVCDATFKNIQERRLDGQLIPIKGRDPIKSKTWAGSAASWPLGMEDVQERSRILIVEGGPDLLAAAAIACRFVAGGLDDVGFVCITGAGNALPEVHIQSWIDKAVTLFEHADRAGASACDRWREQLQQASCKNVRTLRLRDYAANVSIEDMAGNKIGDLADAVQAGEWLPPEFWRRVERLLLR